MTPSTTPPPPHRRFLRLVVDIPTFSEVLVDRFAPGEHDATAEYRVDPDLGSIDPLESGIRLPAGALLTLEADKLTDAALHFVPAELQSWVCVGSVLIFSAVDPDDPDAVEPDVLRELLTSDDPGPWAVELWVWPRADRLDSLAERIDTVLATPTMGFYREWLSSTEGEQVLTAIVAEAPAGDLAQVIVALSGISHLWAFLPPKQLAGWLAERQDAATVATTVVEAAEAITHPLGNENYGSDLRRALDTQT